MSGDRDSARRWLQTGAVAVGLGAAALLAGSGTASAAEEAAGDSGAAVSAERGASPASAARGRNHPPSSAAGRTTRGDTAARAQTPVANARPAASVSARRSVRVEASQPEAIVAQAQSASATAARPPGPIMAGILAAQAYVYGYPLMEYERVRAAAPALNTMMNLTSFANPDVDPIWQAIGGGKRPNTDTFYSLAELDLSDGPVVLTIPDMGDRYYSFQLTDPYTNVTGYIGSRTTGGGPGAYAITWTGGPQVTIPGTTVIEVPYASMMMLGRTLAGNIADQETARELIKQYTLTPYGTTSANDAVLPANSSAVAYLDGISDAMAQNPPPAQDADILAKIARIGVGAGLQVADADLGILSTLAVDVAVNVTAALLPTLAQLTQLVSAVQHHGWAIPNANIGNFGTDYLFRAGVAEVGLVANTQDEAMYEAGLLDSCYLPLNGFVSSYTMHFDAGQLPPAEAFWSITVYDADGNLVPNADGRYSVSSSRPDELVFAPDGSLEIVFAQSDPGVAEANWLAIPAGGFSAYLRMYVPEQAALDRSWVPPVIQRRSIFGILI